VSGCIVLPAEKGNYFDKKIKWNEPAIIGGYNTFKPKKNSELLIKGKLLDIKYDKALTVSVKETEVPLLVSAKIKKGCSYALAFDLAPHWVGGFVDWGICRMRIGFNGSFIEVGGDYFNFVSNLILLCIKKGRA